MCLTLRPSGVMHLDKLSWCRPMGLVLWNRVVENITYSVCNIVSYALYIGPNVCTLAVAVGRMCNAPGTGCAGVCASQPDIVITRP